MHSHLTVPTGTAGSKTLPTQINSFTCVVIKLGVQVLLFGVEFVVDTVHCNHQSEGTNGCGNEQTHFGTVFVQAGIC